MFQLIKQKIFYLFLGREANKLAQKTPKSWRTTILGSAALLTIFSTVATALFDEDPATNVNWSIAIPAILTALQGIFARDQKAHEEGLRPPEDQSKRPTALTG